MSSEHPELPYLAAGAVAVLGATVRDGRLPELTTPIIGVIALIVLSSASAGSRIAPLVSALGYLLLLATALKAVNTSLRKARER